MPKGNPLPGDRAVFDAKAYPERHANDTDFAPTSLHHTLGTGANQGAPGNHIHIKNKLDGTSAPTINDDSSAGYSASSIWVDLTANKAYICVDATVGAAIWNEAGGAGHDPVTVSDTTTVDITLTGQLLSAAVIPGGIKLDDLGAPDNNTDLDASTAKHGLMKKFPGGTTNFLREDGMFTTPAGGGDVVGPASAVDGHMAVFDTTTGKLLRDGGAPGSGGAVPPALKVIINQNFA